MKIVYEVGDPCPVCQKKLEEVIYGDEDESVYVECTVDSSHYSRYIGMRDDLDE